MTPEMLAGLHGQAMKVPAPWSVADFADLLVSPDVFLISQGEIGFALGRVVLDEAELLTLVVGPDHQRNGIGKACLSAFEQKARSRGAARAHLEVAADNAAARGLYAQNGWTETGLRRSYYKAPTGRIDAILMTKSLFGT